jgi:hypothetical protein
MHRQSKNYWAKTTVKNGRLWLKKVNARPYIRKSSTRTPGYCFVSRVKCPAAKALLGVRAEMAKV